MGAAAGTRRTRELVIGMGSSALAVGAMAIDHLVGDEPGLGDPLTFGLAAALSVLAAALIFGRVLPRAQPGERSASRATLVCNVLAVPALRLPWLGLPFVLGGGAFALGLRGGGRRARVAVMVGALVLALATGAYVYEAGRKLL